MKFYKSDVTHTMVGRISELVRPETASGVHSRELSSIELRELFNEPKYDLTNSAIEGVEQHSNRHCFGTFNDGALSAYIFLATNLIPPDLNTAGDGFGGIGMRLPDDVLYIYKGFSLPEYRGQRQVNIAIIGGADSLVSPNGWMVSTVEVDNFSSIKMLENVGLKRQDIFREYRFFGKGRYKIPEAIQLGTEDARNSKRVEIYAPA